MAKNQQKMDCCGQFATGELKPDSLLGNPYRLPHSATTVLL